MKSVSSKTHGKKESYLVVSDQVNVALRMFTKALVQTSVFPVVGLRVHVAALES